MLNGFEQRPYRQGIVALVTMALAAAALWLLADHRWVFLALLPVLLLGFHYRTRIGAFWRAALIGLTCAVVIISGLQIVRIIRANLDTPPEWDFLALWLNGRVADQGLNFYDPASYQQQTLPVKIDTDFTSEILNVGFWYPPPSILLFAPLGWFPIRTAYLLWSIVNGAVLLLDIALLWRLFLKESGVLGLALSAALLLTLRPILFTFAVAQTNLMVLLTLLLFWADRDRGRSGIWLAIGILIKPFVAVLLIYPLLRRHWRSVLTAGLALVILSLITIVLFSPSTFFSYFTANPAARLPGYVYTETINQSLLGTILRLTGSDPSTRSPFMQPLFLGLALILIAVTAWLTYRADARRAPWLLALILVMALIVYPATLDHYGVLMILVVFVIWSYRGELNPGLWGAVGAAAFITLEYTLMENGSHVFVALLLGWLALGGIVLWLSRQKAVQPG